VKNQKKEFFGVGSLAVPQNCVEEAKALGWMDVGISSNHAGYSDDATYQQSDVYHHHGFEWTGLNLVLDQLIEDGGPGVWHLHQDIIVTLGLRKENDSWVRPKDGYTEVARISHSEDGRPQVVEMKAEYLKDYLCARGMALYLTAFHTRQVVVNDASFLNWPNGCKSEHGENNRWEGHVTAIHEGSGHRYGDKCAVFHVSRTDVYGDEDIPDLSSPPSDKNTDGHSYETSFEGRKVYRVSGDLWRSDFVLPATASPRIRRDEDPNPPQFIIDAEGKTIAGRGMIESGKWLWFKPDVIQSLLRYRGSSLNFHTRNTGSIICSHDSSVHFGINDLGVINVYAKDISMLETWQQKVWAGFNVSPEGGVSQELLDSQVRAAPATTQAPESFFAKGLKLLSEEAQKKLGISILIEHEYAPEVISKIRFFTEIGFLRMIKYALKFCSPSEVLGLIMSP